LIGKVDPSPADHTILTDTQTDTQPDGRRDAMSTLSTSSLARLDGVNPSLTRYDRQEPAPVLPLRDEPDLLSWLESSGRLVADEENAATDVSTVEEEELSALMGEKEEYTQADETPEEDWED
jgi:hypothetical protein